MAKIMLRKLCQRFIMTAVLGLVLLATAAWAAGGSEGHGEHHAANYANTKIVEPTPVPADSGWANTMVMGITWWFVMATVLGPIALYFHREQKPEPVAHDDHGGHH